MNRFIFVFLCLFVVSCNHIEFVYKNDSNLINPLYEKTKINTSGDSLVYLSPYIPMVFGENKDASFNLSINIKEKTTKRSVETNQATSNLGYELRFLYTLISNDKNCVTYEKEILSNFSIIPKSAGYNYGTDASLEKKYQIAVMNNLDQFISFVSDVNINNCI